VAWSDDGARIVSGRWDKTVRVWDASTGKELLTLKGHTGSVNGVALSADARRIISGGGEVKVWDAGPGAALSLAVASGWSLSVAVSGDGSRLVNGGQDGAVTVWDTRTGERLVLKGHSLAARSVAVSEDGSRIVSGSEDGAVKVWDGRSGKQLRSLLGHSHGVLCVALSGDGSRIVSGNWDKTIKVWDGRSGELLLSRPAHAAEVRCVAISADGSRIASGSLDGSVKVWDGRSGKKLLALTGDTGAINSVALSADGSRLVSGSGSRVLSGRIDGAMKVWDTRSGKELLALSGHSAGISSVALSADGTRIVSGAFTDVKVWDARTGKQLLSFGGHTGFVNSVALSADERCIVSGDSFGNVKVWRAIAEQDHVFLRGPTAPVRSVALSTDGKQLLAQDDRGKVFAWSAVSGQSLPDAPARLPVAARTIDIEGKLRVSLEEGRVRVVFPEAQRQWQARDRALLERLSAFDPRWHRRQSEGAVEAGDDFAAAYHLERLLREQPWDAALHVRQASALARLGRHQQAATHLMHALFLNPRVSLWPVDPEAAKRGDRAAEAGDWPRAVREFQLAVRQPQAPASSLSNLLLAQLAGGDTEGARQTMTEVAQRLRVEKDPRALRMLAYHAQAAPWGKEAGALLEHARSNLAPQRNASTLHRHGVALYRAGRFAEAEAELAASVKAHGKGGYVDTWLFQAMTARQLGKHDEALRLLARFEKRHARQKFPTWQQRTYWEVLLAEARKTVHTPPPMPRLGMNERPANEVEHLISGGSRPVRGARGRAQDHLADVVEGERLQDLVEPVREPVEVAGLLDFLEHVVERLVPEARLQQLDQACPLGRHAPFLAPLTQPLAQSFFVSLVLPPLDDGRLLHLPSLDCDAPPVRRSPSHSWGPEARRGSSGGRRRRRAPPGPCRTSPRGGRGRWSARPSGARPRAARFGSASATV
jgi:WD40 repeat protein/tetratricopeptide (TPR) repeat protein